MNIASQITRIQSDRDQLRTKAIELKLSTKPGVDTPAKAITNTSNLDEVASAFDSIEDQGQRVVKHVAETTEIMAGTVTADWFEVVS